jgi:outer membrane protein assembly factor BamA
VALRIHQFEREFLQSSPNPNFKFSIFNFQFSIPLFSLILLFGLAQVASAAPQTNAKPAVLKISGFGLLGNHQLKRLLRTVELENRKPDHFEPGFIEDSALILTARVKREGYLQPTIAIEIGLADGSQMQVRARDLLENPLPRPLRITSVHFQIHKGVLYYFKELEFEGLPPPARQFAAGVTNSPPPLTAKEARSYFVETETLFSTKRSKIYTPERLDRGRSSLTDMLDREGYRDAKAELAHLARDDKTGAVSARIRLQPGPQYIVRSVQEEFFSQGGKQPDQTRTVAPNQLYSRIWLQDFTLSLKTNQYHRGFPDASVEIQTLQQLTNGNIIDQSLLARIRSGQRVRVGAVEFNGQRRTSVGLLSRCVRIQRGEWLDRIKVEEGRYRLAQLGVFDTVDLDYRPVDEHTRDVLYGLKEGKMLNLSLLFGWGSYELLRGGVQANFNDLWGLAHRADLKVVQSFKASSGDFVYTIPEFVDRDVDLFVNGSGLRREEVNFTRLEYGGGIGLHKYFRPQATDLSVRYNYQILSASDFSSIQGVASEGLTNPAVGSVTVELKHDRRDNPLYPRHGYKIFLTVETAARYLGGDANYERVILASSWHHPLGGGRFISLGLSHAFDVTFGSPANNLPFNKRFFLGGENSIRGYNQDEASPINEFGQIVGAETYTLASVELEQALTPKWSLVLFSDNLGFAHSIEDYPFDTGLYSVGVGIRWRTLIGPVRLEYGYNLNPRPTDPSGTLLFSLGFPF